MADNTGRSIEQVGVICCNGEQIHNLRHSDCQIICQFYCLKVDKIVPSPFCHICYNTNMNKYTIAEPIRQDIIIEKSRFICSLAKAATEEEAQEFIKKIKKEYWDATHNCSAYVIGANSRAERSSDDGEPSGTAGLPMLEVLRKNSLYNVAVVVTRYFGGIKLGAGGLVRAYTGSVAGAVAAAGRAEVVPMGIYSFLWDVDAVGKVLNILYHQEIFTVGNVDYGPRATINVIIPVADKEKTETWLTEALRKKIELYQEKTYGEERRIAGNEHEKD